MPRAHWTKQVPGEPRQPTPLRILTAPLLITAVPAVVDVVTDPEEGLQNLFLHTNWWVVLHSVGEVGGGGGAQVSAGSSQEQPGQARRPETPSLDNSERAALHH